jgi:hypothetical protein
MTIHIATYFVYRHPFYINNVPTFGEMSLLLNCFYVNNYSKQATPTVVQNSLNSAFISFIQKDLSEAALYFVGTIIRRLRHALYSGG